MRVAAGLLLAMWLLFMGYMLLTTQPVDYDAETKRMFLNILAFIQLIAWAFIFTMPFTTFGILVVVEIIALLLTFGDIGYVIVAIPNLIFIFMSLAGHRELMKKRKATMKQEA